MKTILDIIKYFSVVFGGMAKQQPDDVAITGGYLENITRLSIGATPVGIRRLFIGGNLLPGSDSRVSETLVTADPSNTSLIGGHSVKINFPTGAVNYSAVSHFSCSGGSIGAGATVTTMYGFVASSLAGATNTYGFASLLPAGAGKWNFYAGGTAPNYFEGNTTLKGALHQTPTRSTVASGSTIVLTTSTNHLLYDQAATVAALTITLPSASLTDGQVITIATRSEITALTVNGGTIYGAPTTLGAGGFASFIYSSAGAAWFRKG